MRDLNRMILALRSLMFVNVLLGLILILTENQIIAISILCVGSFQLALSVYSVWCVIKMIKDS